ncbi:MAG: serine/threonine protein kinase [Deltaproteobacteria bacterium]|nr:serine/threonine protein kinase [Deltaproteobacteria bacterium]
MSAEADLVGSVAGGKYRVVGRLGAGTMGVVYEAQHVEQGHHVALKVLKVDDKTVASRFLREAKTMSLFQHRNIIELLEVGALDDGTLYFATELVRGGTLRDALADGPLESLRALAITRQILEALGHAHAMGVVHRDIKPENIMLAGGPDGEPGMERAGERGRGEPETERAGERGRGEIVKILDFGVAKLLGDTPAVLGEGTLTITGYGALGTPFYMSPEAVLGRVVDARADLYSVAAMLFELLTGKPPFAHEDVSVLMRMHAAAPIPKLSERAPVLRTTPELELVVAEALAKKPELRFKSAAEMIEALDAAARSLAEPEPPAPTPAPTPTPVPKSVKATDVFGQIPLKPPAAPAPSSVAPAPVITPHPHTGPMFAPPMPPPPPAPARPKRTRSLHQIALEHRKVMFAGMGVFVLIIVVAIVASRGGAKAAAGSTKSSRELARSAGELVAQGHPSRAVELLEREDLGDDAAAHLVLGHARLGSGRRLDGLAAYERAIALDGAHASDSQLRSNLNRILETRDAVASVVALELASRLDPPAHDLIKAQAQSGKLAEVRRRAFAIAERERVTDGIDRVESWSLDLAQATTCEDRLAAVMKLRRTGDPKALPALRRVRAVKCIEREVAEAIAHVETPSVK